MKNGNRSVMKFLQSDPRALSLLTLPAVLLFITFVAFPIVSGINISFTNWNGYSQEYSYVGFDNYRKMFTDPQVWTAFRNTLIYGFGSTLVQTILGLAFAMLLVNRFLFRGVARTIIYLPAMVAQLIIGYIWYFIVTYERGALNDIVALFGVDKVDWMSRGFRAVMIIMMINAIAYCGKTMIIFIAGLESIPNMYNEAASIDGANAWQVFRHITMPMNDQWWSWLCLPFTFLPHKLPIFWRPAGRILCCRGYVQLHIHSACQHTSEKVSGNEGGAIQWLTKRKKVSLKRDGTGLSR